MLETSKERVKLLKAGISARRIEQMYLKANNFKIINIPVLFESVKIMQESKGFIYEASAEFVNA
ncbi:MAG: hypothetical protein C3F06_06720 [Candidatus Methanoperedenaceae archaeon]|nr:MAG: hypothetical protein C3F06_06720 [Candidatus Methanoperedenaceae archaeon]